MLATVPIVPPRCRNSDAKPTPRRSAGGQRGSMNTARGLAMAMLLGLCGWTPSALAQNQTPTLSTILPGASLPFRVSIDLAGFALPSGIHSGASATFNGKWLLLAGRTNGMHAFNNDQNNFPPKQQNTTVFVVDPVQQTVATRALTDPGSGLTQTQIDSLSVTSPQSYQAGSTLYVAGGYGVDTATGHFSTKSAFTAIDIPGLIHWVTSPGPGETAAQHIRQIFDPIFQITGGYMTRTRTNLTLLIFGQNFQGFYLPSSNGSYSQQVRRFRINDDGVHLSLSSRQSPEQSPIPIPPDPSFRRRDLNVVPVVSAKHGFRSAWVALSGVFTLSGGAWTVPVAIDEFGVPSMADPSLPRTFKQGMNNYASATLGAFSERARNMYTVLLGGISFGFFSGGTFQTDPELPFINQVTAIKIDAQGRFTQYLLDAEYPVILSTQSNPGNPLLFGAGAQFILADGVPAFDNGVVKLDKLGGAPAVVGYIVGGIQSTLPNTNVPTDSAASPFVFTVTLIPQ